MEVLGVLYHASHLGGPSESHIPQKAFPSLHLLTLSAITHTGLEILFCTQNGGQRPTSFSLAICKADLSTNGARTIEQSTLKQKKTEQNSTLASHHTYNSKISK